MLRKIKRSVARYNIMQQEIPIFGKYGKSTVKKLNKRPGKFEEQERLRSYFARSWRSWL